MAQELCFDKYDDGSFDKLIQDIKGSSRNADEERRLLTDRIVKGFVRFNMTCFKDKNNVDGVDGHQFINPIGASVPKNKKGEDHRKRSGTEASKLVTKKKSSTSSGKTRDKRGRIDEDYKKRKGERSKKRKKVEKVDFKKIEGLDPPPDFSAEIKERVSWGQEGVSMDKDFRLRIMKQLFETDMSEHHDRFSMPSNQVKDKEDFEKAMENGSGIAQVQLVELDLKESFHRSTVTLRRWPKNSKKAACYVLTGWKDVLRRNKGVLKMKDIMQVYTFRRDKELWFVVKKVKDADELGCAGSDGVDHTSGPEVTESGRC